MKKFEEKGRSEKELKEMREYGYVELDKYAKSNALRGDGYFCSTCKAYEHRPETMPVDPSFHDGYCRAYRFRDTDYGCCNGWTPKK